MPAKLEKELRATAIRKGLKGARKDAYVYGTMNKLGLMHGNKKTHGGK